MYNLLVDTGMLYEIKAGLRLEIADAKECLEKANSDSKREHAERRIEFAEKALKSAKMLTQILKAKNKVNTLENRYRSFDDPLPF